MQSRLGRQSLMVVTALTVVLVTARWSSASVITIDDGAQPGKTDIPFTCSVGSDGDLWLPAMGFVYRNVEPFELSLGDTIAFDIQMQIADPANLGFRPQVDIALAHAPDPLDPFTPTVLPDSDFTVVAHAAIAASSGNRIAGDYDLAFTVDAPFRFPGGGLIIRVNNPKGALATKLESECLPVIVADAQPNGTNRLVGTFKLDDGEPPFVANTLAQPGVPYVRIIWTRCGDLVVSGAEACDDGNTDNTDACTNSCQVSRCGDSIVSATEACDDGNTIDTDACTNLCRVPRCGDGLVSDGEVCDDGNTDETDDCTSTCQVFACGDGAVQRIEECDNSAHPDAPDPFCDDSCHLDAFAKGSGCSTDDGAGLAAALVILGLALRRRAGRLAALSIVLWASSAQAQRSTDGFRVDRFAMAPSVDDGLVVQDPSVLRDMSWSMNGTVGFTNTLLRVVPKLSSNDGVDVVGSRLSVYLDFAMGFRERFEVNVSVPFALAQSSESGTAAGTMLKSAGAGAVGDARLGGSVLLYGRNTGPQLGLAATVAIPIGSENSFTGDSSAGAEFLATAGFARPGYRVVVNCGVRVRPEADYVSSDQGTELIGRAGLFVPVANHRLMTSLELDASARASGRDAYTALGSPILALLGARYHFPSGLRAGAGIGTGLTDAPGSPAVRMLVTVGYSPEPKQPRKPKREPPSPPPPIDSDGDSIRDNLDKCPSVPEDFNGFEDDDGCPDGPPDPNAPLTFEQMVTLPAPIEFKFDTAIMLPGAEVYLFQVLEILKAHSEVLKLEIQGHTSSEGGPEYNMRLSNDRARAVLMWLVDRGIDAQRLVPHGYGLTLPLQPNDSEPHRQRNRRVQFRLLEQVPGSVPVKSLPGPSTLPGAAPPTAPSPVTPPPTTPPPATPAPATPSPATPPPTALPLASPPPAAPR